MFAGCRESEFLSTLPWPLRAELQENIVTLRWMDDVVRIWRDSLSRGGKRVLRRLGAADVYSRHLVLARTWSNVAFGFHCTDDKGILTVQQIEKWVQDFAANSHLRPGIPLYSGRQFDTRKRRVSVLYGYILRLLECSNQPEPDVQLPLSRLAARMHHSGHSSRDISDAIRAAARQALLKPTCMHSVSNWPASQIQQFRDLYDATYRALKHSSNLRMVAAEALE